jgi:predicted GNAT family acetyltransferase
MEVLRPPDAAAFLELARPLLERDEARHNLILGIAGTLVRHPDVHPVFHLWVAVAAGRPVAAALRTEPYNLVLADPASAEALDALLRSIREDGTAVPGIVANVPHAEDAARRWASLTGSTWDTTLSQGVFALTAVRAVPHPPGSPRVATPDDRPLLVEWLTTFAIEALPRPEEDVDRIAHTLDTRFSGPDSAMWLWEAGERPVSLAGFSGPTITGIRIGPVYTPLEHRGRGYATALVADLSRHLLGRGHRACFLYTDLSNATSNAIYERVGYVRVAEAAEIRFHEP